MTRMYDSTAAADIPADAPIVAGYDPTGNAALDAGIAWSDSDFARFPSARHVHIARFAFQDGDVLDVEIGDATPAEAPGWIRKRQAAGLEVPTIYCNRSTLGAVEAACLGLAHDVWLATLDGAIPAGFAAVQYAGSDRSGGHYDLSETAPWWPRGGTVQPDFTDTDRQNLQQAHDALGRLESLGDAPGQDLEAIRSDVAAVRASLLGLSVTSIGVSPARLAAALRSAADVLMQPPTV
jgi:hypothetical protein